MAKSLRVKIEKIIPNKQVSENFNKAELIGVIEGEWPQEFLFEFPKDKASLVDDLIEGTYCTIHYNYRTSSTEGSNSDRKNYFLNLQAWKVEV